jgi:prepilin-type N-terminal cleavage/methylation domain-containing protein
MKGFTLLEIILTMAILAILAAAGFGLYYGFQTNIKVDEEAQKISDILRQAQANAISGEQGAHNHNNKRYFRYKAILCSNSTCSEPGGNFTPQINDVIVNWSP